jgi:hypothetical protein
MEIGKWVLFRFGDLIYHFQNTHENLNIKKRLKFMRNEFPEVVLNWQEHNVKG